MNKSLTIKSIDEIKRKKVKMNFSEEFLKGLMTLLVKDNKFRTLKTLRNTQRLISILDEKSFDKESDGWARLSVISLTVDAILEHNISGTLLKSYVKDNYPSPELVDSYFEESESTNLTDGEITYVLSTLSDRLAWSCVVSLKNTIQDVLDAMDDRNITYKEKMDSLTSIASAIQLIQREASAEISSSNMFSLRCDKFDEIMDSVMIKLQTLSKCYVTGIKRLNSILGGGFLSNRLYCYVAFPGKGKSIMLLKAAIDIKKYNHIEPDDPNKTPAILLLTTENEISESVGRLFNMAVSDEEITSFDTDTVKDMMKSQGGLTIDKDGSNMDIIMKYYKINAISASDMYTIIDDLENDGYEIKVLIVDYLKRIRSVDKAYDEKQKLKNVTNELKALAVDLGIPVITAHQLNRTSASVVDNALQSNKTDVTRLIGRDAIGDAWEINENCDWICIINQEISCDDEQFMAFKMLKRRYKSLENNLANQGINYFAHPFDKYNKIKLIDDLNNNKSLSLASLGGNAVDVTMNTNRGKTEFDDSKIKEAFSVVDFTNDEGLQL